jgi:hypothetical protein
VSTAAGLVALIGGVVLVVGAADVFVDGLLGVGRKLRVSPFVLTVALSGFETENLAAGIAANAKGLPAAAAGRFLGDVTFLALGDGCSARDCAPSYAISGSRRRCSATPPSRRRSKPKSSPASPSRPAADAPSWPSATSRGRSSTSPR